MVFIMSNVGFKTASSYRELHAKEEHFGQSSRQSLLLASSFCASVVGSSQVLLEAGNVGLCAAFAMGFYWA